MSGTHDVIAKRVQISQPATLYFGRTAAPIQLLDLSLTGALALADAPPVEGTMISVACASEHVAARVVWKRGKRFGLAFAHPLDPEQAEAMAGYQSVPPPMPLDPPAPQTRGGAASLRTMVIKRNMAAC